MQKYALTSKNNRISASDALSQIDYFCPECSGIVRIKHGEQRQPHFFHLAEGISCRIRLKNSLHKAVQTWLIEKLNPCECTEECFFPSIHRIADVAYHKKQVVFEVQLSPISAREAMERTFDYYRIGWHVIWVLHVHTFGRQDATQFEEFIEQVPHYFTDVGYKGGKLWDEGSYVHKSRRVWLAIPPIRRHIENLEIIFTNSLIQSISKTKKYPSLSLLCQNRKTVWPCRLQGDLLDNVEESKNRLASPPLHLQIFKKIANRLYLWYLNLIA